MTRPELFPALLQKLQSPDVLLTQRVYLVLNQTLKELSTKRLAADQRNFAEVRYEYDVEFPEILAEIAFCQNGWVHLYNPSC